MPTYEYMCKECQHAFETSQKITDVPLQKCPECHKDTLQRGIGGGFATFRFLGNGFYLTDYKKSCGCAEKNGSCPSKTSADDNA